ncbi:MAG: hypothetical protein ACM3YF_00565, partial [Candidatus Zixiibacteriota bacterium]
MRFPYSEVLTFIPVVKLPGGDKTTRSPEFTPSLISVKSPKTRPVVTGALWTVVPSTKKTILTPLREVTAEFGTATTGFSCSLESFVLSGRKLT